MHSNAIGTARSLLFDGAIAVVTIPIGIILGMFGFALPLRVRFWLIKCWRQAFSFFERHLLGIRVVVVGAEHIPNEPCIIISNHQSAWETVGLQTLFSPCVFVLKEDLLKIPFFGWGLAAVKMIAINRDASKAALKKVAEQGIDRLKQGISVVVFPEGTRSDPHDLLPFQIGGAYLATKSNVPVVPVLHNAGTIWPKGSRIRGPGVIKVTIGEPIMPGLKAQALNQRLEDWMRRQIPQVESDRHELR